MNDIYSQVEKKYYVFCQVPFYIELYREESIYDLTTEIIMVVFTKLFWMARRLMWNIFFLLEKVTVS